ncbi:hypothetical protein CEXT_713291 [Caerostris extrusa]|uniref:Uncharacterized protein n=1 Tax=Caerostris extrusa TaxID=172846 RepID=A0AAV4QP49_CAEEX|nr:hypothetical protein CEXT_713291 [Caerostris extrusa]
MDRESEFRVKGTWFETQRKKEQSRNISCVNVFSQSVPMRFREKPCRLLVKLSAVTWSCDVAGNDVTGTEGTSSGELAHVKPRRSDF